jgi:hypothetical protein
MTDEPTPEAARTQIDALKTGTDTTSPIAKAFADPWNPAHQADVAKLNRLHDIAGGTAAAPATNTPNQVTQADALARLSKISAGGEPDLVKKFLAGDVEAAALMEQLHKAAYPESADQAADEPPELIEGPLPIEFDADMPMEQQLEATTIAKEAVAGIGLDKETALFSINALQQANAQRAGRLMDQSELDTFDKIMAEKWGANFEAKFGRVQQALRDAGRGQKWLHTSLYAAGPDVAAAMFETLSNLPPKQARR